MKNIIIYSLLLVNIINADFIRDNIKETIRDTDTCLIWQDNNISKIQKLQWSKAIEYCENLIFAQEEDWRLPNFHELYSLTDRSRANPSIQKKFKNVSFSQYWSSTTNVQNENSGWSLDFGSGGSDSRSLKIVLYNVRCVRGGK